MMAESRSNSTTSVIGGATPHVVQSKASRYPRQLKRTTLFSNQQSSLKSFFPKLTSPQVNQFRMNPTSEPTTFNSRANYKRGRLSALTPSTQLAIKTKPNKTKTSTSLTLENNSSKRGRIGNGTTLTQLFLDLGQEDFGKQTICSICGMLVVHGFSEDILQHRKICQLFRMGVPFHSKTARVLAQDAMGSVVEIRPSDCREWRERIKLVESIVDEELGFVQTQPLKQQQNGTCDTTKTFLMVHNKRVIGMAMAMRISHAFVLSSSSFERSKASVEAMVGIRKLWVHERFRKKGIATRLVNAIRLKFVFGMVIPVEKIAFSSPTMAGMKFAHHYVLSSSALESDSIHPILVYDCC